MTRFECTFSVAEQPIRGKSILFFYGYKYLLNIAQYNYPIYRNLITTRTLQSKHSHYKLMIKCIVTEQSQSWHIKLLAIKLQSHLTL